MTYLRRYKLYALIEPEPSLVPVSESETQISASARQRKPCPAGNKAYGELFFGYRSTRQVLLATNYGLQVTSRHLLPSVRNGDEFVLLPAGRQTLDLTLTWGSKRRS